MKHIASALFLLVSCTSLALASQTYVIDRSHSQAKFFIRHFAETVEGTFNDISGNIAYEESDITKSKVHVVIKIASVDTRSWQRDRHLQGDEFFDARNFPNMVFDSQRVEKRASGLVAIGTLTMRGTTRPIEIPFSLTINHDSQASRRLDIRGATALNRRDYKVGSEEIMDNQITLGNEVKIELALQAIAVR
jgi:polyisoprenoid-binding protein YceI